MSTIRGRPYTRSSSFKMAMLFTVLCGTAALILGYLSFTFDRQDITRSMESHLQAEIADLRANIQEAGLVARVNARSKPAGKLVVLYSAGGDYIAGDPVEYSVFMEKGGAQGRSRLFSFETEDGAVFAVLKDRLNDGRHLFLGTDITPIAQDMDFIRYISMLIIALMLVVIGVSFLISGFVVTRTNMIAGIAKKIIDTGDLSQRIKIDSTWDDLSYMSGVLNETMDRIEQLMQGIRQVTDNIAHDLRTPLTRLRNNLEDLQKEAVSRNDSELREKMEKLLSEADHILNTFTALLRISRIETEKRRTQFRDVDLGELVTDVRDLYEPLAEQKSLDIYTETCSQSFYGDRDLLFQAFTNLVDNAVKFTPPNGYIEIKLEKREEHVVFSVKDTGPGVAEGEEKRIFERFYRGEASRKSPGSGLGLSLVAAITHMHGGFTKAENWKNGFRIGLYLPIAGRHAEN